MNSFCSSPTRSFPLAAYGDYGAGTLGLNILLAVVSALLAAFGFFMVWVSQIDEAKYSPLGPTRTVGIASLVVAGVLVAGVAARMLRRYFAKTSY